MKRHSYRSRTQILGNLLSITKNAGHQGVIISRLEQKGNLGNKRMRSFVTNLTGSGLVNKIQYDGKNTFIITERGKLFLDSYQKISELANSFGLKL